MINKLRLTFIGLFRHTVRQPCHLTLHDDGDDDDDDDGDDDDGDDDDGGDDDVYSNKLCDTQSILHKGISTKYVNNNKKNDK
jgi:hypothetical protein